jgi:hypothetical protein
LRLLGQPWALIFQGGVLVQDGDNLDFSRHLKGPLRAIKGANRGQPVRLRGGHGNILCVDLVGVLDDYRVEVLDVELGWRGTLVHVLI